MLVIGLAVMSRRVILFNTWQKACRMRSLQTLTMICLCWGKKSTIVPCPMHMTSTIRTEPAWIRLFCLVCLSGPVPFSPVHFVLSAASMQISFIQEVVGSIAARAILRQVWLLLALLQTNLPSVGILGPAMSQISGRSLLPIDQ